jgi:BCD family chlorophyll transporter-like MFS transporter
LCSNGKDAGWLLLFFNNSMDTHSLDMTPRQATNSPPKLPLLTMLRLGLFQMGLGIMSILTLGVLNRILIDQAFLAIPATIAGGTIAMYQFVSPVRIWFGQRSDAKPLFGSHRTGYVRMGAAFFTLFAFLAVQVIWQMAASVKLQGWGPVTYGWIALLALMFALYGVAVSSSSTPFAALLVDVSDEDNRSQLVGIVWAMLMVGIVMGAITSAILLKGLTLDTLQSRINQLFMVLPAVVLGAAFLATAGVEQRYSRYRHRSIVTDREDQITLKTALKVLTASRQTGFFFCFLLFMTLGLFLQQPILEPYAGEVFGMNVSQSTQLNAFWGMGTLMGITATGFLIVPRFGKQATARAGCLVVSICFLGVIAAGLTQAPVVLQGVMFALGLGFGLMTNSAVSLMLDLTAAETAGTFIGAWGLAQAMAQAGATVLGGVLLDTGRVLFGSQTLLAYGFVFFLESLCMLAALMLLNRVSVAEFRDRTQITLNTVLAHELDN